MTLCRRPVIKTGLAVSAAVLATTLVLTGCGGSDSSSANQTPDAAASDTESAGPGASPSTPAGEPDGAASSASSDGAGSRPLPDGFPESEIPVVAGTVVDGSKGDAGGPFAYTVLIRVPGTSPAAVMRGITSQLKRTGFKVAPGPATAKTSIATFTSTTYDVGVNVIRADGKTVVTYVVVRKTSS